MSCCWMNTAGLDWSVRGDVLELLQDLARDKVLIVVTHEPDLFQRECEHETASRSAPCSVTIGRS